jgi:hypothetical protein
VIGQATFRRKELFAERARKTGRRISGSGQMLLLLLLLLLASVAVLVGSQLESILIISFGRKLREIHTYKDIMFQMLNLFLHKDKILSVTQGYKFVRKRCMETLSVDIWSLFCETVLTGHNLIGSITSL